MENKELQCLNEIMETIEKYGFEFPKTEETIENSMKGHKSAMQIIKRVRGIIGNATEDNAQKKLDNIKKFLSVVPRSNKE